MDLINPNHVNHQVILTTLAVNWNCFQLCHSNGGCVMDWCWYGDLQPIWIFRPILKRVCHGLEGNITIVLSQDTLDAVITECSRCWLTSSVSRHQAEVNYLNKVMVNTWVTMILWFWFAMMVSRGPLAVGWQLLPLSWCREKKWYLGCSLDLLPVIFSIVTFLKKCGKCYMGIRL